MSERTKGIPKRTTEKLDKGQMECPNSDCPMKGEYFFNGGQPTQLTKINGKYIIKEIGSVLSFKKGILFTIKELLIRPGQSVQIFITKDRRRLVKPVIFVIFCSFLYTILQKLLQFDDGYSNYTPDAETSATKIIIDWIQRNAGYANILMAIFVAFWIKVLFRKYAYNFFEILVLLLFVFGMVMLISSLFGVMEALTGLRLFSIGGLVSSIYTLWAIGQFYDGRKIVNYLKGLLSYILGLLSAIITAVLLRMLIDLMT